MVVVHCSRRIAVAPELFISSYLVGAEQSASFEMCGQMDGAQPSLQLGYHGGLGREPLGRDLTSLE